jgi:hypothetical protein
VIPKKLKITEPKIEKIISVIKAVKDPFHAMFIFSSFENRSVITNKIGAIPIGLMSVKNVVRQRMKN